MNLLVDTQLLLWAMDHAEGGAMRLPRQAAILIRDAANVPHFSAASIWEVAIKFARGRADFDTPPADLRAGLLGAGYVELPVTGEHAAGVADLAPIHRDPFDRLLLAQARAEGLTLLTADATLARYPGPVLRV